MQPQSRVNLVNGQHKFYLVPCYGRYIPWLRQQPQGQAQWRIGRQTNDTKITITLLLLLVCYSQGDLLLLYTQNDRTWQTTVVGNFSLNFHVQLHTKAQSLKVYLINFKNSSKTIKSIKWETYNWQATFAVIPSSTCKQCSEEDHHSDKKQDSTWHKWVSIGCDLGYITKLLIEPNS